MKNLPALISILVLSFLPHFALATNLIGKVVKIQDGDTITIIDQSKKQYRIRFAQIDAPESKQPWGSRSKSYLTSRVAGETVTVVISGKDHYKRVLGTVFLSGININAELVETGNAWAYTKYVTDKKLFVLEKQARLNKAGLWQLSEKETIAPWIWRKTHK